MFYSTFEVLDPPCSGPMETRRVVKLYKLSPTPILCVGPVSNVLASALDALFHLEPHTRSQNPHFMSYPMDMTWILQHQVYFLAKCHHICFSKSLYLDIPGIS